MSEDRENRKGSHAPLAEQAESDSKRSESLAAQNGDRDNPAKGENPARESGGPKGLEPTRYGDWEKAGRCIDF